MDYTLAEFWLHRLGKRPTGQGRLVQGWTFQDTAPGKFFKEAPLTVSTEFTLNGEPEKSPIILVAAPGAVGKSTLARQIAYVTGSVYVDLASSGPVGASTFIGEIVNSGLHDDWRSGAIAVLLDGLDEAKLKANEEGFHSFLSDVADQSADRAVPTVLFGRTAAIQEARDFLVKHPTEVSVLEIGYYGPEAALDFANSELRVLKPDGRFASPERDALRLLLEQLRSRTESDGDRFAGYAPVLQAVARQVEREPNAAALIARIQAREVGVTLQSIVLAILEREQGKFDDFQFEDPSLIGQVYLPGEQLDRLVVLMHGGPQPTGPEMSAKDAEAYTGAVDGLFIDHPFIDHGGGGGADVRAWSAVFDAAISAWALRNAPAAADVVLELELKKGSAANPFLFEFYRTDDDRFISSDHIGVVYSSFRAGLSLGDTASLLVQGSDEVSIEEDFEADVDFILIRQGSESPREESFWTDPDKLVRLGAHVEDVSVVLPLGGIELGPGLEANLIAPINIQCDELTVSTERLVVEKSRQQGDGEGTAYLEARTYTTTTMFTLPIIRDSAELSARFNDMDNYYWRSFKAKAVPDQSPEIDEALRRLRNFVIVFQSHRKVRLARLSAKIENNRMTRGSGRAILDLMVKEGILSLEHPMYFLDPTRLAQIAGVTYDDCMSWRFGDTAVTFAQRALQGG